MKKPSLTRINELLIVSPETGEIVWRRSHGRAKAGSPAGRINTRGYREVCVDTQDLMAHAIVWFKATGDWPERIDHINGQRADNRIANLREADAATNARNRTNWRHRKLLGAFALPAGGYAARLIADGRAYDLGVYATEEEAHARYVEARRACAVAEEIARTRILSSMQRAKRTYRPRAQLTVLEEMQAARRVAA